MQEVLHWKKLEKSIAIGTKCRGSKKFIYLISVSMAEAAKPVLTVVLDALDHVSAQP